MLFYQKRNLEDSYVYEGARASSKTCIIFKNVQIPTCRSLTRWLTFALAWQTMEVLLRAQVSTSWASHLPTPLGLIPWISTLNEAQRKDLFLLIFLIFSTYSSNYIYFKNHSPLTYIFLPIWFFSLKYQTINHIYTLHSRVMSLSFNSHRQQKRFQRY